MRLWHLARFPHYRRHMNPVLQELETRGIQLTEGQGLVTFVAGIPDVDRVNHSILIEHGAGQPYVVGGQIVPASGGKPRENVCLFLSPSERVCELMRPTLPNARMVVCGSPAVEHMPVPSGDRIVFAAHWHSSQAREAGSAWPWSAKMLKALVVEFGDRLIVHAHPRMQHRMQKDLHRFRIPSVFVEDWEEAAKDMAVLVCDNSSIIWESAYHGVPVVLVDPPQWTNLSHGLRWGPEAEGMWHASNPEEAVTAVLNALSAGRVPSVSVYDRVEGSTRLAADAIMEHLGELDG